MTEIFTAVVVFATIAGIIAALRADDAAIATNNGYTDELRRIPDPGPRDMHAVTGVLARAHVPSWG